MRKIVVAAVFGWALLVPALTGAQVSTYDTSDDLRHVPIPPVDRSKIPALIIRGATLLDGYGKAPITDAVIVMRGDRIVAAGARSAVAEPTDVARTIDARGLWIMPGMIDLHCHLTSQRGTNIGAYPDTDASAAIRGTQIAASRRSGGHHHDSGSGDYGRRRATPERGCGAGFDTRPAHLLGGRNDRQYRRPR